MLFLAFAALLASDGLVSAQETSPAASLLARREAQILESLKNQQSPDPYLLHELGTISYRQGKVLDARRQWSEAAAREPNLPGADIEAAHELMIQRKFDAARVALENAEESNRSDPHAAVARGRLALLENDLTAAREHLERAQKLNPKLPSAAIWLGRLSEQTGELAAAASHFLSATRLAQNRPEGWLALARVHFRQEDLSAALEALRKAEQTGAPATAAEAQLAELFVGINDFVGAMQWYRRAVERKPDDVALRRGLAVVQVRLGMKAEALAQLEKVLAAENEDVNVTILMAQLEEELSHPDRAEALYRNVLKANPQHMIANNNLAMLRVKNGQADAESIRLAETALKAAPRHAHVLGTYGCALAAAGKFDEAREPLTKAIRGNPGEAWSRYYLAKVLMAKGERDEALESLEGCLILDPKFPRADDVRKMTDELKSR
jgi:cellulose synthase operon protein C